MQTSNAALNAAVTGFEKAETLQVPFIFLPSPVSRRWAAVTSAFVTVALLTYRRYHLSASQISRIPISTFGAQMQAQENFGTSGVEYRIPIFLIR
ncbi:hypothetical protein V495_01819 [Pseudogymnoascus sp. VKM F-4514 (FW-929)]|nr:hypothetical protein V495_01819 [Pseudogymnoascus sp. VKM F-4514 (FW-929)]KFY62531.1 hypothetical protein V497_02332 [Pseudogymnoascus sp. VKM F-4516 (FW-969)]